MAIQTKCSACFSYHPITLKQCRSCGESLLGEKRSYRVRVRTPEKWETATVKTIEEARKIEAEFLAKAKKTRGLFADVAIIAFEKQHVAAKVDTKVDTRVNPITFKQVWDEFYPWVSLRIKRPDFYEYKWRCHVAKVFESRPLAEVSLRDIEAFYRALRNSPVAPMPFHKPRIMAPKTALDIVKLIGRLYSYAIEDTNPPLYVGANPYLRFKAPKVNNLVTNDLTLAESKRLIEVLEHWENRPAALAFKLCLMTGKRTGEVFPLVWRNVDLEAGFIRFIVKSQTQDDIQHYPISPGVRAIFEDALKLSVEGSGLVFPSEVGKIILYPKIWARIKVRARIPLETRAHDLRHTFASRLLSSGKATLAEVQKLLNHKSPQMTERYAHLADEAMKRAAYAADEIFG